MRTAVTKVSAVVLLALLGVACDSFSPLERDTEDAGITLRVTRCKENAAGVVTATVQLQSKEQEYETVLIRADLLDSDGTVIAQGSTSAGGVEPGRTYELNVVYGTMQQELPKEFTCEARLDFATKPFG